MTDFNHDDETQQLAGELFHIDTDGGVLREDEITAADLEDGHLVFRSNDGQVFSAHEDGLYELDDELAGYDLSMLGQDASQTTDDGPDGPEQALFEFYLQQNNGDMDAALQDYSNFEHQARGTTAEADDGFDEEAAEEAFAAWLGEHPEVDVSDPDFNALLEATGDLDQAAAAYVQSREILAEERAREGGPNSQKYRSYDEAFAAAKAAGEIGRRPAREASALEQATADAQRLARKQRAASAVKPADRTAEQKAVLNARSPDTLGAALDDFGAELAAAADVKRAARERIAAERLARGGRV